VLFYFQFVFLHKEPFYFFLKTRQISPTSSQNPRTKTAKNRLIIIAFITKPNKVKPKLLSSVSEYLIKRQEIVYLHSQITLRQKQALPRFVKS